MASNRLLMPRDDGSASICAEALLVGGSAADMVETVGAGHILLADRADESEAFRGAMTGRGAWADMGAMSNRVRTFPFSQSVYRQRRALRRQTQTLARSDTCAPSSPNEERAENFPGSLRFAQSASGQAVMNRSPSAREAGRVRKSARRGCADDHRGEAGVQGPVPEGTGRAA